MKRPKDDEAGLHGDGTDGASGVLDAAVRRTLVGGHRDLKGFLRRLLHDRGEADEVLQRFVPKEIERRQRPRENGRQGAAIRM